MVLFLAQPLSDVVEKLIDPISVGLFLIPPLFLTVASKVAASEKSDSKRK